MAISTPLLLLLLPILASTLQGDSPEQPGGGALQWDQGKHGGLQGSETWFTPPGFNWPPHLQSKRFGKITKREKMLDKKDEKMMEDENMRKDEENMRKEEEEQRIDETIRILQGVLLRGRKY